MHCRVPPAERVAHGGGSSTDRCRVEEPRAQHVHRQAAAASSSIELTTRTDRSIEHCREGVALH